MLIEGLSLLASLITTVAVSAFPLLILVAVTVTVPFSKPVSKPSLVISALLLSTLQATSLFNALSGVTVTVNCILSPT